MTDHTAAASAGSSPRIVPKIALIAALGGVACSGETTTATGSAAVFASAPEVPIQQCGLDVECIIGFARLATKAETAFRVGTIALAEPPSGFTTTAGTLPGELAVSGGAASYSIPLQVPIGIGSAAPSISLQYSSTRTNGYLGVGWSLAGFSRIERCPRIAAHAGGAAPINDNAQDAFCLDGRRLEVVSGSYGADGSEYRTEMETFSRVIASGDPAPGGVYTGPQRFEVRTREGQILEYGGSDATVDKHGAVIRGWALVSASDRDGNSVTFEYSKRYCEPPVPGPPICIDTPMRPTVVRYGGHAGSGANDPEVTPDRELRFVYTTGRNDWSSAYTRGAARLTRQRLDSIEAKVAGARAWIYHLGYEELNGTSRLNKVWQCGPGATPTCQPPTTFSYDSGTQVEPARSANAAMTHSFGNGIHSRFWGRTVVLDANGDGRDDLLVPMLDRVTGVRHSTYGLQLGRADSTRPFEDIINTRIEAGNDAGNGPYPCFSSAGVIDFNHDGKDDLLDECMSALHGWRVFLSTGTGFTTQTLSFMPQEYDSLEYLQAADLNGDSWTDILHCKRTTLSESHLELFTSRGPGQGYAPARVLPALGRACHAARPIAIDVDGDGVANLMAPEFDPYEDHLIVSNPWNGQPSWFYLALSPTSATWVDAGFAPSYTHPNEIGHDTSVPYWAETQGWVCQTWFAGGGQTGLTWCTIDGTITPYAASWHMRVLDYNADGLPDILQYWGNAPANTQRVSLYVNTGHGFSRVANPFRNVADLPWYNLNNFAFQRSLVVDWNNDGRQDLLVPAQASPLDEAVRWVLHTSIGMNGPFDSREVLSGANLRLDIENGLVQIDHDGDGDQDIIAGNYELGAQLIPVTTNAAHLLVDVTNGVDRKDTVAYGSSQSHPASPYSTGSSCSTTVRCDSKAPPSLVAEVRTFRGVGVLVPPRPGQPPTETTSFSFSTRHSYEYVQSQSGLFGRGWLGFARTVETIRNDQGAVVRSIISDFDNDDLRQSLTGTTTARWYPFAGTPNKVTVRFPAFTDAHGRQVVRENIEEITGRAVKVSAAGRPFTHISSRLATTTDVVGSNREIVVQVETAKQVDSYGQPTREDVTWRRGDGAYIDSTTTIRTFDLTSSEQAAWLLGRPDHVTQTSNVVGDVTTRHEGRTYDNRGRLASSTLFPDSSRGDLWLRTTHGYDRFGNRTTVATETLDEQRRSAETIYDPRGLTPVQHIDGVGLSTTVTHDTTHGGVLNRTDPSGVVETTTYDAFARPVTITSPGRTTTIMRERATLGTTDSVLAGSARLLVRTATTGSEVTEALYDSLGRDLQTRTIQYNGAVVTQERRYDWANALVYETRPHLVANTSQGSVTYNRDSLGRVIEEARDNDFANDHVARGYYRYTSGTRIAMDKLSPAARLRVTESVEHTDSLGVRQIRARGPRGEVVATQDGLGGVSQIEYGPFGLAERFVDAAGNVTGTQYDELGRARRTYDPDRGETLFYRNAFGDVMNVEREGGQLTYFNYDAIGRVTKRTEADGREAHYYYDGPEVSKRGRLDRSVTLEPSGAEATRTQYWYVPSGPGAGQVDRVNLTVRGETFETRFEHDTYGRVQKTWYPPANGIAFGVENGYDANGHVTSVRNAMTGATYWSLTMSDQGYRIGREGFGNGTDTTHSYWPRSGLLSQQVTKRGAATLQKTEYTYDSKGLLGFRDDFTNPNRTRSYFFDALGRLTRVYDVDELLEEIRYDATGNVAYRSPLGDYSYDESRQPHAVRSVGANAYAYDYLGRQVSRSGPLVEGGAQQIEYTGFDLPSRIVTGTGSGAYTHDFTYDADNARVHMRRSNGDEEWYVGLLYERARIGAGHQHRYRIWRGGSEIAQVTQDVVGGQPGTSATRYLHADLLGTPSLITDGNGAVAGYPHYDPYGKTIEAARGASVSTGFTGHREDVDLGLIDMRGRYYDPVLGRFLTADTWLDPLLPQSLNPYSYVLNSPLRFTDPTGFLPEGVEDPTEIVTHQAETATIVCESGVTCVQEGEVVHVDPGEKPVVTEGAWGIASRVGDRYYVRPAGRDWVEVDFATYDLVQWTIRVVGTGAGLRTLSSAATVINGIAYATIQGMKFFPAVGTAINIAEEIATSSGPVDPLERRMGIRSGGPGVPGPPGSPPGGRRPGEGTDINPKIYANLEKQLRDNGAKSIHKALQSAHKALQQHKDKLAAGLQYPSQVEGTIDNVSRQIRTIMAFIKDKGLE